MAIVTLLSDMGERDFYVAAVKAAILSQAPGAVVVDISHQVNPFNLYEAAFQLRSVYNDFPLGTVHVIGVNAELRIDQPHVVVHYMGHYFVGADNGIFSLLFDQLPEDVWEITLPQHQHWTFPMRGVFATVAAHLSKGGAPELVGRRTDTVKAVHARTPIVDGNVLRAMITHIDALGNAYTNVNREFFEAQRAGRKFTIHFRSGEFLSVSKISEYFNSVVPGQALAMFASNGLLMLAVNGGVRGHGGSVVQLFGLKLEDLISIEFYDNPAGENDFS